MLLNESSFNKPSICLYYKAAAAPLFARVKVANISDGFEIFVLIAFFEKGCQRFACMSKLSPYLHCPIQEATKLNVCIYV